MRTFILCFITFLLPVFWGALYAQNVWGMSPWFLLCVRSSEIYTLDYKNFYHEHDEKLPLEQVHVEYEGRTWVKNAIWHIYPRACNFYAQEWKRIVLPQFDYFTFSDIQFREDTPFLRYLVPLYTQKDDVPIAFVGVFYDSFWFLGTFPVANGYQRKLPWFHSWIFSDKSRNPLFFQEILYEWQNYSADAYLKSLEEPYSSAPMLQMYWYFSKPLLVARSQTGMVTHAFFQGRDIENPLARAKIFLGEKFYHP